MAIPEPVEPTIKPETGSTAETVEEHPAYACIGVYQTSSSGHRLFGSDFKHQHFVSIRVSGAVLYRGGSYDRHHPTKRYLDIAMSEAQWAAFVSSVGSGTGVPCTLEFLAGTGHVPGLASLPDRREQFKGEFAARLKGAREELAKLRQSIMDSGLSAKVKKTLLDTLRLADQQIYVNLEYTVQLFDEHIEKGLSKAKIEVEAYLQSAVIRAGLQALGAPTQPVRELDEGSCDGNHSGDPCEDPQCWQREQGLVGGHAPEGPEE